MRIVDMFMKLKGKLKSVEAVMLYVLIVVLVCCGIIIRVLSVDVLNKDELRKKLIGRKITVENEEIRITEENLSNIEVIWRETKRDVSDKIDIKIDIDNGEDIKSIKGVLSLKYKNGIWLYDNLICKSPVNLDEEGSLQNYVINHFQKDGFTTIDNKKISSSIINKISNVKFDDNLIEEGKKFTMSIVLYNGACFQNCDVEGEVYCDNQMFQFRDIKITSDNRIYKEKSPDKEVIEKTLKAELLRGGDFEVRGCNKHKKEKNIKFDLNNLEELSVKDYIIRDDYSVRAEVEGKIYLDEYKDSFEFDGVIVISGMLSDGNVKNSKKIIIYEVPFDEYYDEE